VFDPTPISDSLSGVLSLAQGNYVDAGLSFGAAFVPYAGDTLKAAKYGKNLKYADEAMAIANHVDDWDNVHDMFQLSNA